MKPFFWKIVICLVPNLLAGWAVWHATNQYRFGEGGFKLGVDLVGGTILVYEIDTSKTQLAPASGSQGAEGPKALAAYLKRRIDPNDLFNYVVRMVGDTRVEIILPTGGKYRTDRAQRAWNEVIEKVKEKWAAKVKDPNVFDVGQGKVNDLAERIKKAIQQNLWPPLLSKPETWEQFKQIARDWQVSDAELNQIKPGDYQTLLTRLQNYPNAVRDINTLALNEAWKATVAKVQEKFRSYYPALELKAGEFSSDRRTELIRNIQTKGNPLTRELLVIADTAVGEGLTPQGAPPAEKINQVINDTFGPTTDEVTASINKYYQDSGKPDVTAEEIQKVKEQIAQVGKLEFLILANDRDDQSGADAAQQYLNKIGKDKLEDLAKQGLPPPGPLAPDSKPQTFEIKTARGQTSTVSYSWFPLFWRYRKSLELSNKFEAEGRPNWAEAAKARNQKDVQLARIPDYKDKGELNGHFFIYSRPCLNTNMTEEQRKEWRYDYFILVRDPEIDTTGEFVGKGQPDSITGKYLSAVSAGQGQDTRPVVNFQFDSTGARLFRNLTGKNVPEEKFYRHLAIVLDGEVMTAPTINSVIEDRGQISGNFTAAEVNRYVGILRSGALPATLKPQPVSENTMGATLGEDTIHDGVVSVGIAFLIVLVFMAVYYRFAGLVACTALLSNLLLTVGFMVAVQATFTLPGLAGLVLMIGMAVDANVLIYERLREERERGASLSLALRNGYDRAFPTIIDTHLSSIFTAIVLYVVGNDQLKGFGVSLTAGLIISLFTSLYMTRTIFDIWQYRGWLKKLSMFKLFSKPNFNFMGIRYYWFTATIAMTIIGMSVFLARGQQGLNIDFVGGTAYSGHLKEPMTLEQLRYYLNPDVREKDRANLLEVKNVKQLDKDGHEFRITFTESLKTERGQDEYRDVYVNKPEGNTAKEKEANVGSRIEKGLPDLSIEQIFLSIDKKATGDKSSYFTVRTVEKEVQLVQAAISRLLMAMGKDGIWRSLLERHTLKYQVNIPPQQRQYFLWIEAPYQPATYGHLSFWKMERDKDGKEKEAPAFDSPSYVTNLLTEAIKRRLNPQGTPGATSAQAKIQFNLTGEGKSEESRYHTMLVSLTGNPLPLRELEGILKAAQDYFDVRPPAERLENFDSTLAAKTRGQAVMAIILSWGAILLYLWFRFGNWTFGLANVLCLVHDLFFTLGIIALASYLHGTAIGNFFLLEDFKLDLTGVAALLTLVGYSANDTIVVFDRIREVRGKNPDLTPQMINDSVNQTLSRTLLTSFATWLVVIVLYIWGGPGVHLFSFIMVVGVVVGTYSSIYIASPLLLIFGEGRRSTARERQRQAVPATVT